MKKPKIGLLGLMLKLYDEVSPQLKEIQTAFAKKIIEKLNKSVDIVFQGIANTREEVNERISIFMNEQVDIIVCICFS